MEPVVLLAEDVDRNFISLRPPPAGSVVLLAEDVDRNGQVPTELQRSLQVVLLAEDVDRNLEDGDAGKNKIGRPPRGGRG